jgi:hypothetical protein
MGGTSPPAYQIHVSNSAHAQQRQGQRNISEEQLRYVLRHGTRLRRTGVEFVVLRRCDIPIADLRDDRWARLQGAVVIIGDGGTVVTVYRNRAALRCIRKKLKCRQPRRHADRSQEA